MPAAAAPRKLVQKKVILSSEYKICIKLQKMFCNNTYLLELDQTARKTQKSATNFRNTYENNGCHFQHTLDDKYKKIDLDQEIDK